MRRAVIEGIYAYKSKRVERMIKENQQIMKDQMTLGGDVEEHLKKTNQTPKKSNANKSHAGEDSFTLDTHGATTRNTRKESC